MGGTINIGWWYMKGHMLKIIFFMLDGDGDDSFGLVCSNSVKSTNYCDPSTRMYILPHHDQDFYVLIFSAESWMRKLVGCLEIEGSNQLLN